MLEIDETIKINGSRWLHTLMYGAEKALLFSDRIKNRRPDDFILDKNLHKLAGKLVLTKSILDNGLLGTEVSVFSISEEVSPINGKLSRYNLEKATISLKAGSKNITVKFGELIFDGVTLSSTSCIELETKKPYKL